MNRSDFVRYANDPAVFVLDLAFPTRHGSRRFGDVAAPFQIEWLDAMAPSFLAVAKGESPPTPKFWIEASKGCSKTTLVAALLLWLLIFSRRAGNGVAGAVDKDNAAEVLLAAKELLAENPHVAQRIEIQAWAIVGKQTGCVVEIVATDRKGSQGGRPMVTYVDECSHIDDASFEFVQNLLDDSTKTGGLTIVTSNAGWIDTKAFELRELARTSPLWKFLRWDQPSPLTPPEEIEEARRRNTPSRFNRLYFTVWGLKDGGDAIPADQVERAIKLPGPFPGRLDNHSGFVAGLDLGVKRDHSALVVLDFDASGIIKLASCRSWSPRQFGGQIPLSVVKDAVIESHRRFYLEAVVFDPSQGYLMAEQLQSLGIRTIPWLFTPQRQDLMAHTLLEVFSDSRIVLYDDRELIRDLGRLQLVERATGWRLKAAHDETGHADRAIAMAIALPHAVAWSKELQLMESTGEAYESRLPDNFRLANDRNAWQSNLGLSGTYVV